LVPMRQKVVPRANREAIAGFIRPPLQLGLVKPGTDFRHEVLVRELNLGDRAPGELFVVWDGKSDSGRLVSAGTYTASLYSTVTPAVSPGTCD